MTSLKNYLNVGVAAFSTLFANAVVLAAESDILKEQDRLSVTSTTFLRQGIINIVNYFLGFLGLVTVLIVVYNGVQVVTGTDDGRLGSALKNIGYSLVGIIIIFLAYAVVNFILPAVLGITTQ